MQSIDAVVAKPTDRKLENDSDDESIRGLDIEADSEGWDDVDAGDDEETILIKCLLCDEAFGDAVAMLAHCNKKHNFDFAKIKKDNSLDFYGSVKLVNYIRSQVKEGQAKPEVSSSSFWQDDKYLQPAIEDDGLLFCLDELDDVLPDDGKGKAPVNGSGPDARVAELEAQLATLNTQFTDYRSRASEALEKRWEERDAPQPEQRFTNAEEAEEAKYEAGYFDSYSFNEIHQIMLQDAVRTDSYRDFIYGNKHLFADKVVLDVGCGTGILSLFAAKAGARKVISVDNSAIIQKAKQIAAVNGMSDRISFVQGRVEDIKQLPDGIEKVDVIVSEWMGYCLLYEAMLDSVLHARDRFLKRNEDGTFAGIMAPSHCSMHIAPLADPDWMADNVSFWRDVYGFDMQTMLDGSFEDMVVRHPNKDVVCADEPSRKPIKILDLYQVGVADLEFAADFEVKLDKDIDALDGFCTWFDCLFSPVPPSAEAADASAFEQLSKKAGAVVLSTSPYTKRTHWQCGICVIDRETGTCSRPRKKDGEGEEGEAVPLGQGAALKGTFQMTRAKEKRAYDIGVQWSTKDGKEQGKQRWKMR
ncbi:hypothetical protein MBLNU230_g4106t1 [Neophaeotheca triangularis]